MKKTMILMTLIASCFFSVEIYAGDMSSVNRNEQVIVDYYNALNKGAKAFKAVNENVLARGAYLDYYGHRTDLMNNLKKMQASFPDHHAEILNIITEGDQVFVRTRTVAVQKGPFLGIEPTNKPVTIITSNVFHFNKNHQIVFLTQIWSEMDVMKQLGYIILS